MNMTSMRHREAYTMLEDIGKYLNQFPSGTLSLKSSFCSSDKIPYNCPNHMRVS